MSEGMPDFALPTDAELAAERRAAARARAHAADPTLALRAELGLEQPDDDAASLAPVAVRDGGTPRRAARHRVGPRLARLGAARRRVSSVVRHPVVAFAAGAALVAGVLVAGPALAPSAAAGSTQQLQQLVDDYVAALEAGDVAGARALHEPDGDAASLSLLDAGVSPTTPPMVACATAEVSARDRDVASARCDVAVAGTTLPDEVQQLRLERVDGSWRIDVGLAEQVAPWTWLLDVVAIGGIAIDPTVLDGPCWLLPGDYAVEAVAPELVEVEGSGAFAVGGGSGGWLDVWPQASDALLDGVEAFADAWARDCVSGRESASPCDALLPPRDGAAVSTEATGAVTPGDALSGEEESLVVALLVEGTGSPLRPQVEVEVRFTQAGGIAGFAMRQDGSP